MKVLPAILLLVSTVLAEDTKEAKLDNGLKVIVHRMTGAPLVTVMTMYRVGSANEQVGQTGITHLCEHMLFKGSKRFPNGQVSLEAEHLGGYVNGYTNVDQITFFQVVPKEHLGYFLDGHADAMADATFDPEEFKKEMVVVRSELEGDENNPAWLLERSLFATAFQAHGLHWPVIGWRADVERITAEQLKAYYKTWFRPNNAVVVVVGDVEIDSTIEEVRKRFASIEPGQTPFEPTPEPPQDGERRITVRAACSTPQVEIAYHVPPTGHPDMFCMEVMQNVLGEGHRSRLYRALVDTGLATTVGVGNYWCKYPTLLTIHAECAPGKQPAEVEAAIDKEIDRLRAEGVTPGECARAIRFIVRSRAFSTDSTEKVASAIADFEAYSSWRYGLGFAEEVQKVTPERLLACAKKYLVRDSRVVGELIPSEKVDSADLRGAMGEIDRAPKVGAGSGIEAREPKPPVELKPEGVPAAAVLFWENPSSRTFSIKVRWAGGTASDGQHPGLASVTLEMLHEGTKAHDKEAFNALLEAKGLSIEHTLHAEYAEVSIAGLAEDFETGATLLGEMLQQPAFPEASFAVARDRVKGRLAEEADSPDDTGLRVIRHTLFPQGHSYYAPTLEEELSSIASLTRDEVREFHATWCVPGRATVAVSGAIEKKTAREVVEKAFGGWKGNTSSQTTGLPKEPPADRRIVVFQPEKSQVFGGVAMPCAITRSSPDWAAFDVMNEILGNGSIWATRLGKVIRVQNGLAYDTFSAVTHTNGNGYFWAQFGSNPENVDKAMALLEEEVKKIHDEGVTPEEVEFAVTYKLGAFPRQTETADQKADLLLDIGWYGLGLDYITRRAEEYKAVTKEGVDAAAKKYLDPSREIEVIVGTYGKK